MPTRSGPVTAVSVVLCCRVYVRYNPMNDPLYPASQQSAVPHLRLQGYVRCTWRLS